MTAVKPWDDILKQVENDHRFELILPYLHSEKF